MVVGLIIERIIVYLPVTRQAAGYGAGFLFVHVRMLLR